MTGQRPSYDLAQLRELVPEDMARMITMERYWEYERRLLEPHDRGIAAWREALAAVQRLDHMTTLLTQAVLLAAGFHRDHRGEWRRRRHVPDTHIPASIAD